MIYIRPFGKEDLAAFVPMETLEPVEIKDEKLAKAIEDSDLSITGIRNGKIVGCGGVHPIDDISGEVWMRLSKDCLSFRIETIRLLKSGLKIIEEIYPFKVLHTIVKCDFKDSVNMIEKFGFVKVEKKKKDDQDWFIYTKRIK